MNQEELRLRRCCFTGHRPDKMELLGKEISYTTKKIKLQIRRIPEGM